MKASLCAYWSTLELVLATLFCFTCIFLKIKQHRLKLRIGRIQCTPPPLPLYIIPWIPSEQKAMPVAIHTSAGGRRWASYQQQLYNLLIDFYSWALLHFSLDEEQGPAQCKCRVCCMPSSFPLVCTTLALSSCFSSHSSVILESCSLLSTLGRFGLVSN